MRHCCCFFQSQGSSFPLAPSRPLNSHAVVLDSSVELLSALSPEERELLAAVTEQGYPLRTAIIALQKTGQQSPEQVSEGDLFLGFTVKYELGFVWGVEMVSRRGRSKKSMLGCQYRTCASRTRLFFAHFVAGNI